MPSKRRAAAAPAVSPSNKKQKTAPKTSASTSRSNRSTASRPSTTAPASASATHRVVPATPGTRIDLSAAQGPSKSPAAGPATEALENGHASTEESRKQTQKKQKQKQKQQKGQSKDGARQQPSTLPAEPHAALLAELRPKYNVRLLSVISSTRMEKRIGAIMEHLREPQEAAAGAPASPGARVVLLHARTADVGKMISIAEIAKRRIREGLYAADKQGKAKKAALFWFQANRLYDVVTEVKAEPKSSGGDGEAADEDGKDDEDDEDDGFEPMPRRFQEAVGEDAAQKNTTTKTYMSIFLSRVSIPELHKHDDITCQASTDPVEIEHVKYMTGLVPGE